MVKGGDAMKKLLGCFLCVLLLTFGAQAHALPITIDPAIAPFAIMTGDNPSQSVIDAAISSTLGSSVELYKQNVGGSEVGALASSYETAFYNTPSDPSDATISYVGGDIVGPTAFLLVKDGNQEPAWYLYNLTSLGWNGMDDLVLENFWPDQGAISHVSLYGTRSVPEPATMLLFGTGILCLGMFGRKKFKQ
jgi:PEP-CTERM motif-containing protein